MAAVEQQDRRPDEVLVVDASTGDATRRAVDKHVTTTGGAVAHLSVDPADRGLTRQRNLGIKRSTGTIVSFLDDDTVPAPSYFAEVLACFDRHPTAVGVGGAIDEGGWKPARPGPPGRGWYRYDGWERPEGPRWRLRRILGLAPAEPPGYLPRSGHGRPVAFLPPTGRDYPVEFLMGGASSWRRSVLRTHQFSPRFEGYGLYEDLDFCIDVRHEGGLVLCTRARLRHDHDPAARPHQARYGRMVVENGWYVWRRRWPAPSRADRARWWLITLLLVAVRLVNGLGSEGRGAVSDAAGRCLGMMITVPAELSAHYRRSRGLPDAVQP